MARGLQARAPTGQADRNHILLTFGSFGWIAVIGASTQGKASLRMYAYCPAGTLSKTIED